MKNHYQTKAWLCQQIKLLMDKNQQLPDDVYDGWNCPSDLVQHVRCVFNK